VLKRALSNSKGDAEEIARSFVALISDDWNGFGVQ